MQAEEGGCCQPLNDKYSRTCCQLMKSHSIKVNKSQEKSRRVVMVAATAVKASA